MSAIFGLNGVLVGTWAARVPAVQDRFGVSDGGLGLILAMLAVGGMLAMPLAGLVTERFGSRRSTRVALLSSALALPLAALADSPWLGALAVTVFGATGGALDVSMNAHGVAVERRHVRAVLSSFHAAFSAGGLVGAGTGSLLAGMDVRIHFAIVGGAVLVLSLAAIRPMLAAEADARTDERHGSEGGGAFARPPRALWALGVVSFFCLVAEGATGDWSAVYLHGSLGAGEDVAALGFAAFSVTMTLGRAVGDPLYERMGSVGLVRAGGALAAVGLVIALLADGPTVALVGFALVGAGLSSVVPTVLRVAGTTSGIAPGVALAAVSTVGYTGFLAGPPIIGGLASLSSLPTALSAVAVGCALVVVLAGRLRRDPVPTATGRA